ncbi:hypothetical protein ACFW9M_34740 [Streptomyces lydicus]|uniref:hypothetical protein n=1 Tax=Streptomyces lydicus TaxID=47763 RepID=UPI003697CD79
MLGAAADEERLGSSSVAARSSGGERDAGGTGDSSLPLPELLRQVLVDDRTFDVGGVFYEKLGDLFADSVVTCPHARHRGQRRMLQPAFQTTRITGYAKIMEEHIAAMAVSWHDGETFEAFPVGDAVGGAPGGGPQEGGISGGGLVGEVFGVSEAGVVVQGGVRVGVAGGWARRAAFSGTGCAGW